MAGLEYRRFHTLDHHRPADETVNEFVAFVLSQTEKRWWHFHCRGGSGRTSTFMLMYDMMHNAAKVSLNDILQRHILAGSRDMPLLDRTLSYKAIPGVERWNFIQQFYDYCRVSIETGWNTPFQFKT